MIVSYKDDRIIEYFPDGDQWWITSFNPSYQNVNADNLSVIIGVGFDNVGMYYAFKNQWNDDSRWTFFDYLGLAILEF